MVTLSILLHFHQTEGVRNLAVVVSKQHKFNNYNFCMNQQDTVKQILKQARQIRERTRTSCVELENFLYYQQLSLQKTSLFITCGICSRPKTETKKQFRTAFKKMTKKQQAQFYLMNVKNVEKFLNLKMKKIGGKTQVFPQTEFIPSITNIQLQIQSEKIYKKLSEVNAQILGKQKIIKIEGVKSQIDLHCFLIRKSKNKMKNCLVLESIQPFAFDQTVRICFSGIDYEDSFSLLHKTWGQAQYQNIKKILTEDSKFTKNSKSFIEIEQDLQPITPKLLKRKQSIQKLAEEVKEVNTKAYSNKQQSANLTKISNSLISNEQILSLNSFQNFNEKSYNIFYHKDGVKVRKIFEFKEDEISMQAICCAISDIKLMRRRKTTIIEIKHINSIPSQRTNIFKEINLFENKEYEFVYFRHETKRDNIIYYYQKSIDFEQFKKKQDLIRGNIISCIWRIKKIGNKIQVLADAEITYNKNVKNIQNITSYYIGQFTNYLKLQASESKNILQNEQSQTVGSQSFQNEYLSEISEEEQFYTVTGSLGGNEQKVIEEENQENNNLLSVVSMKKKKFNESYQKLGEEGLSPQQTATQTSYPPDQYYIKYKHRLTPFKKQKPCYYVEPQGHIVWGNEWKIDQRGGLVNLNMEKIKAQSSVLKLVLKRLGKNLFSGKGIMNISLPIQIFGIDSHLERLCRGYTYGPTFLEKASTMISPVQRLKNIFCFGLGTTIAYIKMQKPFNPVIGETYQGMIDGCPIYAEQTSHHPPISSLLFIGRGYRVYGCYEAKIQMGLNSASGINDGFTYVQFEKDKSVVKFNGPPGLMEGIIIGDRKLTLAKKTYYIDQENRLMLQIIWGQQNSNPRFQSKLSDFFSGKIVKVKDDVDMEDYKKIKPQDIEQQFGQINGRFTQKVYFNDKLLFDISEIAPHLIEDYSPCLHSDSRLRKDIIQRKKNNLVSAQDAKEEIEQFQRNDRKLRKKQK